MSEPSGEISEQAASGNAYEFSVSELSQVLRRTVEENFGHVRVRGEVTGYRGPHASGHVYFALKDETARLEAVIWKGSFSKLRFKPAEGLEVIATGKLTTYPGSSKYQIVIERLEPAGIGALMALLEERRKKLATEGLFAEERKRRLPFLPEIIGVITSPTGAVIRDILHRLSDRFPRHVIVWPVRVQGETSAAEVAAAIKGFNELKPGGKIPRPDLLIVARGGGSIEDLWSFNEEIVVRAASASDIPLISAVGHETDTTLIDFASDRRAPTPTAAAEMAVPVRGELLAAILDSGQRLHRAQTRRFEHMRTQLRGLARAFARPQDLVAVPRQRFDHAASRLVQALIRAAEVKHTALKRLEARLAPGMLSYRLKTESKRVMELNDKLLPAAKRHLRDLAQRLEARSELLQSYSYQGVLSRGYAVVRDADGKPVRNSTGLKTGDHLALEFAGDDRIGVAVEGAGSASPSGTDTRPKKSKAEPNGQQGKLF